MRNDWGYSVLFHICYCYIFKVWKQRCLVFGIRKTFLFGWFGYWQSFQRCLCVVLKKQAESEPFCEALCVSVFQSAAMEETVIWEQHTVTLHRVGICYSPSALYIHLCPRLLGFFFLPNFSLLFLVLHLKKCVLTLFKVVCKSDKKEKL